MADSVQLGTAFDEYIDSLVNSGRYGSRDDVFRQGIRLIQEQESWEDEAHRKITEGLAAADSGDVVDGEAFFDELQAKYRAMIPDA